MFPFNMLREIPQSFKEQYKCYSISMLPGQERLDVEKGGKIIMPPSALHLLTRLNIQYPMLFKLTNSSLAHHETHCGVLEFIAEEGKIYLPYWMMKNLLVQEGQLVVVENVSLPTATFAKFRPESVDFLDITNPKAVLENALRSFACLTTGDTIAINYNNRLYELYMLETKPGRAVSIIECDMNVDFAPPVGYKEPQREKKMSDEDMQIPQIADDTTYGDSGKFRAFSGAGVRLDGKVKNNEPASVPLQPHEIVRGVPNYNYKKGTITFIRSRAIPEQATNGKEEDQEFKAFSGVGQSLRKKPVK